MARHESDREDILREATALVVRAELSVPGESEPVVVGFRRDGAASIFFGGDPVYQFNTAGELRRAYVGGLLYKAQHGRLVELNRQRSEEAVVLLSRELLPEECDAFLEQARHRIAGLARAVADSTAVVQRQVPAGGNVGVRIRAWLDQMPSQMAVARSPRVG
ncbi:MAG TPA: hypothetical protein VMP01_04920 [Pirellulaceae bacterium]|nr:hypothetical protein [Pirellulaceae bacterium]